MWLFALNINAHSSFAVITYYLEFVIKMFVLCNNITLRICCKNIKNLL